MKGNTLNIAYNFFFWMKLIFKAEEQERHFMVSFQVMPRNFEGTYPRARCIIEHTEHFYQKPSFLTVQSKVLFIQAPCYICSNLSCNFYHQFMVKIYF